MKRIAENQWIAWIVLIACVLFSLSFSSARALSNLRAYNEAVFYTGTSQPLGPSINENLTMRGACAYNIASTAGNYPSIDRALVSAAKDAADALAEATTIADKKAADTACDRAVQDLYTAIENTDMSTSDRAYALSQYREFQAAADRIRRDDYKYNEHAADFNRELSYFPAAILAGLAGVAPLPLFS